ncbi:hypothetical protein BS17DRAFT_441949 [Gyrodon lividus]|nr:hypothetical protein BS17DRAFT_441949 [Gyrodon lividus]
MSSVPPNALHSVWRAVYVLVIGTCGLTTALAATISSCAACKPPENQLHLHCDTGSVTQHKTHRRDRLGDHGRSGRRPIFHPSLRYVCRAHWHRVT